MDPSSSMVYSAEMLSCRNRPSGSFFCRAYHLPAYCEGEEEHSRSVCCLQAPGRSGDLGWLAHPLGVEVLLDVEAVHDAGGGQAALDAGQQHQQQGHFRRFHSEMEKQASDYFALKNFCFPDMHIRGPVPIRCSHFNTIRHPSQKANSGVFPLHTTKYSLILIILKRKQLAAIQIIFK